MSAHAPQQNASRWPLVRLGDVCEIEIGKTPSRADMSLWDKDRNGTNIWVSIADLSKVKELNIFDSSEYISEKATRNMKKVAPGSLLVSFKLSLGKMAIAGTELYTNEAIAAINVKQKIELDLDFLRYQFLAFDWEDYASGDHKVKGLTLNKAKLREIGILLPPLAEQQRIVARLEAAFAAIAEASAAAEVNLRNARALFDSYLDQVFSLRGPGWVERRLGDVCLFENGDRGSNYPNRNEYVQEGIPWINAGHILADGSLDINEMNFITKEKYSQLRSGKIRKGDLLYCLRGTLGKTAFVYPYTEGAIASSLVILRPKPILNDVFLYFYLVSPEGQKQMGEYQNGTAQPNLGAKSVAEYIISMPPIENQLQVANILTQFRDDFERLHALYISKLTALAELKQALLAEVFGEG